MMNHSVRVSNYKRLRRDRGIKLVMSIMPMLGSRLQLKRATCGFEGRLYVVTGKTNIEALEKIMAHIIKGAKID